MSSSLQTTTQNNQLSSSTITSSQTTNTQTKQQTEDKDMKNAKYKTMMIHGTPLQIDVTKTQSTDIRKLEEFLESEKSSNKNENWGKLNKSIKIKKLIQYANTVYKKQNNLTDNETTLLIGFFKDCLERKKLQKIKDVIYDKKTGIIKDIPGIVFNKTTKAFTLKNNCKTGGGGNVSTLKCLAPKKNTTLRNSGFIVDDTTLKNNSGSIVEDCHSMVDNDNFVSNDTNDDNIISDIEDDESN